MTGFLLYPAHCEASILPAFLHTPVYLITKISLWCGYSYLLSGDEGTLTHRNTQIPNTTSSHKKMKTWQEKDEKDSLLI